MKPCYWCPPNSSLYVELTSCCFQLHITTQTWEWYPFPFNLPHLYNYTAPYTIKNVFTITQTYTGMPLNWIAGHVLHVDSDMALIEYKSGRAHKAVTYIYNTLMSRLPKSYKCVDVTQWDKPLPSAGDLGLECNTAYIVSMQENTQAIILMWHGGQSRLSMSNSMLWWPSHSLTSKWWWQFSAGIS